MGIKDLKAEMERRGATVHHTETVTPAPDREHLGVLYFARGKVGAVTITLGQLEGLPVIEMPRKQFRRERHLRNSGTNLRLHFLAQKPDKPSPEKLASDLHGCMITTTRAARFAFVMDFDERKRLFDAHDELAGSDYCACMRNLGGKLSSMLTRRLPEKPDS